MRIDLIHGLKDLQVEIMEYLISHFDLNRDIAELLAGRCIDEIEPDIEVLSE